MTDASTIANPKTWRHPPDELAIEFCMDGYIPFRKLTVAEREEAAHRLTERGHKPTEVAAKVHGTVPAVVAALDRYRHREETP